LHFTALSVRLYWLLLHVTALISKQSLHMTICLDLQMELVPAAVTKITVFRMDCVSIRAATTYFRKGALQTRALTFQAVSIIALVRSFTF
jgi:hypothetical protein